MELILSVPGASPEEISSAIAAAEAAVERAGCTAQQAADAAFAVEGWDMNGAPEDAAINALRAATQKPTSH